MKRYAITIALLTVAIGSFAQSPVAVVKRVVGTVEIQAPGKSWTTAKAGTALTKDTAISTGFKSVAVVTLGNSVLTIKPLTRLTLEQIVQQEGSEQVKLYLLAGRVRAEVKPPAGGKTDFSVRSPTATASVRGTVFTFDGWNLDVSEGGVLFTSPDGRRFTVPAGRYSHLDENGNPIDPRQLAEQLAELPLPPGLDADAVQSLLSMLSSYGVKLGDVTVTVDW